MTSTHAILYHSRAFMKRFIDLMEDIMNYVYHVPHDLVFAYLQTEFPCYALKRPMFYQDGALGGQEELTKRVFNNGLFVSA